MSDQIATAPKGETGLAIPDIAALQAGASFGEEAFSGISGSRVAFLPRLQLFTSNSEQVKRGKIPLAHYGIVKGEDLTDAGDKCLVLPIAWRPKAMYVKSETPLAYHKPDSQEFKDIKAKADADSNSGNLYGPEFLLWFPPHGYVTFFLASKTARNEAPALRALLPTPQGTLQATLLAAQFIESKEFSWHGPKVLPSAQSIEYPAMETIQTTLIDFLNPKDSEVKQVDESVPTNADR